MKGIDTLASTLYWRMINKVVPPHIATSCLMTSFNRRIGNVKHTGWRAVKGMADAQRKHIKVVSQWEDSHNFNSRNIDKAIKHANKLSNIADRFPNTAFSFTPFLEHRKKAAWLKPVFAEMKTILGPNIWIINSPINQGGANVQMEGVLNERHHTAIASGELKNPQGLYSFSHDGEDMLNTDIQKTKDRYNDSQFYWAWIPQCNLKKTLDQRIKREDRHPRTIYPPLLKAMVHILENDKGDGCNLPVGAVWKAYAEQHKDTPTSKDRDNKPVFISPRRYPVVKVGTTPMVYTGQLHDGRHVYRMKRFGFRVGHTVELRGRTGGVIGTINPAYRHNDYKN